MKRTPTGWVAKASKPWTDDDGVRADGVYVAAGFRSSYLHLTGTADDEAGPRIQLPTDAQLLRELAQCFTEMADWKEEGTGNLPAFRRARGHT